MESELSSGKVTFQALQTRLIAFVNTRIRNGDFTERGLAKILGISQPQIHNVLKGARKLSPELADRVIRKFEMSVLDLLEAGEMYEQMLSRGSVAVGQTPHAVAGSHVPPKRFTAAGSLKKPPSQELLAAKARAGRAG